MSIGFTQYLRPLGNKREVEIDMPPEIEALAARFIAAGGRFECEELRTGQVSLTGAYKLEGEWQDIAIELCANGPEVDAAVEKLVRNTITWLEAREARE